MTYIRHQERFLFFFFSPSITRVRHLGIASRAIDRAPSSGRHTRHRHSRGVHIRSPSSPWIGLTGVRSEPGHRTHLTSQMISWPARAARYVKQQGNDKLARSGRAPSRGQNEQKGKQKAGLLRPHSIKVGKWNKRQMITGPPASPFHTAKNGNRRQIIKPILGLPGHACLTPSAPVTIVCFAQEPPPNALVSSDWSSATNCNCNY